MSSPCILVVDDEQSLVWAVQNSLRQSNYQVLAAYDGIEALAVAQRHQPDLVVLDVVMPYLDGFEVCRKLRRDPVLADVSVLFLTALDAIEDRVAGFSSSPLTCESSRRASMPCCAGVD
jgi:DNA-binding response OmpR family regulator